MCKFSRKRTEEKLKWIKFHSDIDYSEYGNFFFEKIIFILTGIAFVLLIIIEIVKG